MTSGRTAGVTMNDAPAASARFNSSSVVTVPAPTLACGPASRPVRRISSSAPSEFMVTSILRNPPASDAGTSCSTSAAAKNRRMATMGSCSNKSGLKGVLMSGLVQDAAEQNGLAQRGERFGGHGDEPGTESQRFGRGRVGLAELSARSQDHGKFRDAQLAQLRTDEEAAEERGVRGSIAPGQDLAGSHFKERRRQRLFLGLAHAFDERCPVKRSSRIGGVAQHALARQQIEQLARHVSGR